MSKLNIQKVESPKERKLPIFDELEQIADRIRVRAYNLFANRGNGDSNDLNDWLTAQREICWPTAELVESDDEFEVKVALAGFDSKDVTVTATPRELIVKASRSKEHKENKKSKGVKVRWSEFQSNDVYRQIELPSDVDVGKIKADFDQGMLVIEAPKAKVKAKASGKKKTAAKKKTSK
jgi:HSP20 family protein